MHRFLIAVLVALLAVPAFAADAPKTEDQKTLYTIGLILNQELSPFSLSPAELEWVKQGLTDAGAGRKPEVEIAAYGEKVRDLARARRKAQGEKLIAANRDFLDGVAKEKGAIKTDSGLIYLPLKEGAGAVPGPKDTVKVNYRGTFPDGKEFDNSTMHGAPVDVRLEGAINCWAEGLQKMKAGGKAKLVCPPATAYGDEGAGDLILPGATLVFEVELLEVAK
ncbi:MAG TPA: FKBP-type peptidyl-prolyl cis-trans isomerase [Desulfuromonadaceae bacterium]